MMKWQGTVIMGLEHMVAITHPVPRFHATWYSVSHATPKGSKEGKHSLELTIGGVAEKENKRK